uniref:Uncharacterized protein n=1 Tax=Anguilla anguilla TaxID=7936 RepID=A0A0E9W722_ANGAN
MVCTCITHTGNLLSLTHTPRIYLKYLELVKPFLKQYFRNEMQFNE